MAQIGRLKINWTGFIGAPGYTQLYFRDFSAGAVDQAMADGFTAKTDVWLAAWVGSLPSTVSILVDPTVDIVEETTGELVGFMSVSPDTARVGTNAGTYAAPAGACVNWSTNGVRNGRRVRGRTFMVPLSSAAMQADGSIATSNLTALRTATATFISATGSGDMGVWSRPTPAEPSGGIWYACSAFTLPDKIAVLRSRRD
jgi:hypothetical protein